MSYLVLARKYRPQSFSDIIGQDQVVTTLTHAIARHRLHHAFLFCGGRGTGKTTTARILAKALCCIHAPTQTPCNECPACIEITQGMSIDVQEIDAASQNKVEDIRELRESIRYAPLQGKKKVFILDEVHMLSTSAFNALLKTLEEPPPHAVFIFATTDPHKIPTTILSRVQRYDFKLVSTSTLTSHLARILQMEHISFEESALRLIAQEASGSVRDSLSLLDQVLAYQPEQLTEDAVAQALGVAHRGLLFQLGRAIIAKHIQEALEVIDTAHQRGYDLVALSKSFVAYLRDLLIVRTIAHPKRFLDASPDEIEELQKQAHQAGTTIESMFHRMVQTVENISRSSFPKWLLEVAIVELCQTEPFAPISVLIDRLDQLQKNEPTPRSNSASTPVSPKPHVNPPSPPPPLSPTAALQSSPPTEAIDVSVSSKAKQLENVRLESTENQTKLIPFEILAKKLVEKNPLLHPVALSHPLVWTGQQLTLGVKSQFLLDQIRGKWNLLKQTLEEMLGTHISIEIQLISGDAVAEAQESPLELEQKQQELSKQQIYQHALSHPSRSVVSDVFGEGTIFHEPILE